MPRSRGGAGGRPAARPSAPPSRPAVPPPRQAPTQTRPASTSAAPPMQQQAPAQQGSQGSGLFGQMASTAAGVAVGSSIGHAIGGFFGGGSSAAPAEQQQQPVDSYQANATGYSSQQQQGPCAFDVQQFTQCMNEHQGNMSICDYYLQQLKACQAAASRY